MHRAVVVLLLVSGCAFGIEGPDPARPRSQMPRCDTGKGLVVLDGVMAATAGALALSLVDTSEPAVALLPASIGALYLAGAVRGNGAANRCRAAMDDFESYQAARDTLPPPDEEPRPRPRPPEGPMTPASQPAAAASVVAAPAAPAPAPAVPATVAPPPAPAATPVAAPATPAPARRPAPAPDDDWSAFWREVE